jgi:Phosphoesterase family
MMVTDALPLFLSIALVSFALNSNAQNSPPKGKAFQQWGFLIFENADYSDAVANPTFQKIYNNKNNRLLSQYNALAHPSLPNYLATIAGTTFGITDDDPPPAHVFSDSTILDLLDTKGVSWKVYAEDYPGGGCYDSSTDSAPSEFAVKHLPAIYSNKIISNSQRCDRIVPGSDFQTDFDNGQLPQWWYYIPNLNNDGHDTDLSYMASYLENEWIPRFDNSSFTRDLVMVVTFDESDGDPNNHIYAAVLGDALQSISGGREDSAQHDHYSLLKTVEDNWDLGNLAKNDAKATGINLGALKSSSSASSSSPASTTTSTSAANSHHEMGYVVVLSLCSLALQIYAQIA